MLVLALAMSAQAEEMRSFTLVNGTPFTILQVNLSAHDLGNWSSNTLPAPPLRAGETRRLDVPAPTFSCSVDLKVAFVEDSNQPTWEYLDLCGLRKIRLRYDQYSAVTTAAYEE